MSKRKNINILLVEDNPADVRLMIETLKEGALDTNVGVAHDGVEALNFLKGEVTVGRTPLPDLIILDLNLPRKDGREVLEEIKNDERLRHIPVIILSTSKAEQDILKSYNLHANCYITKPIDLEEFMSVIRSFENFWFNIVELPQ